MKFTGRAGYKIPTNKGEQGGVAFPCLPTQNNTQLTHGKKADREEFKLETCEGGVGGRAAKGEKYKTREFERDRAKSKARQSWKT